MSFPADPLAIRAELKISGVWTNVTSYVRDGADINITRGFTSEQGNTIATDECSFSLNNRDGRFSNKNPLSPYYKLLGRNTKFRVGVDDANGNALWLANSFNSADGLVGTADKAVLDVTGDLELRGDIWPDDWTSSGILQVLASKWTETGNQRSWYVALTQSGNLIFVWSPLGTSTIRSATSTAVVATGGRKAWKVTLDVDNGAAGADVKFFTAPTIGGTYAQLGTTVTGAGTTAVFSSSAAVQVGGFDISSPVASTVPYRGRFYRFQMYNGIGGTLVADANFGAQTVDAASWSDGLGTPNTWFLNGTLAAIASGERRFIGEVAEFPQVWDTTGSDIYSPVSANSVMRRISQGESPLKSSMRRYFTSKSSLIGYWSLENGGSADVTGIQNAYVSGVTFGADSALPSSAAVGTIDDSGVTSNNIYASSRAAPATGTATGVFLFKFKQQNAGASELMRWYGNGTVAFWTINFDNTGYYVAGFDPSGTVLGGVVTGSWPAGINQDQWIAFRLQLTTSSGKIDVRVDWNRIGDGTNHVNTTGTGYVTGTNVGRLSFFFVNPNGYAENQGAEVTQIAVLQESLAADAVDFVAATEAFLGETAGNRFLRAAADAGITAECVGDPDDTPAMGVQTASTNTAVMQECSDVDGGFIYAPAEFFGLAFRTRRSMQNQTPLVLDYAANHFTGKLSPTDDDKVLRNDVTITSSDGTMSATSTITTGPNNTSDPDDDPQGVGRYDAAYSLNVETTDLLGDEAQFATFLGTWDEIRMPSAQVSLERAPFTADLNLAHDAAQLEIGGPLRINNLPSWLPPDPLEVLVRGRQETLQNRGRQIVWICQAYGPFRSVNNLSGTTDSRARVAATPGNSTLNASMASTGLTAFTVNTLTGKLWGTTALKPGNFPLDVFVGGERITISGITGTGTAQVFTPSARSVNGVVKGHSALDAVQVVDDFYVGF